MTPSPSVTPYRMRLAIPVDLFTISGPKRLHQEAARRQVRFCVRGVSSPLLANVYLHFVLDRWFEDEVKPRLKGQAFAIRYADDGLLCFERREDAEKVLAVLPKRFATYGLRLHPEKTRLVKFGRSALEQAERDGTKPDTFDFLGFTHKCARSRQGKFTVHV